MNKDMNVAEFVFDYYGEKNQCVKFIEELSELTRELIFILLNKKSIMESGRLEHLIDELADVSFMTEQFRMHVGHSNVDERVIFKMNRTIERIDKEVSDGRSGNIKIGVAEIKDGISESIYQNSGASESNGSVYERPSA